jgi:hypothetical protein
MTDNEATLRQERRELADKRFHEAATLLSRRGDDDPLRGDDDPLRGDDDPLRGGGPGDGPSAVAADIFGRAVGLGGHLIVAFVAPVGAISRGRQRRSVVRFFAPETVAEKAKAVVSQLLASAEAARVTPAPIGYGATTVNHPGRARPGTTTTTPPSQTVSANK